MKNEENLQKYNNLLSDLEIFETAKIKSDSTRGYFISSGTRGDQDVLIKIAPAGDSDKWSQFIKEREAEKILQQLEHKTENAIKRPKVLEIGRRDDLQWLIREFIVGETLSEYDTDKPIKGYDILKQQFVSDLNIIQKIADLMRNRPRDIVGNGLLENRPNRYPSELNSLDLEAVSSEVGIDLSFAQKIYNKNVQLYLEKAHRCVSFGDFIPSNLIIHSQEEVYISDLEWLSLDNYTTDIAMFWLFLHKYSEWQESFLAEIISDESSHLLFDMSVIRIVLCWYHGLYVSMRNNQSKINLLNQDYFRKHKWLHYLQIIKKKYL